MHRWLYCYSKSSCHSLLSNRTPLFCLRAFFAPADMATADTIDAQVSAADAFFQSQVTLMSATDLEVNMKAMATSLIAQISMSNIVIEDATRLNCTLHQSRFSDDSKRAIAAAVAQRAMANAAGNVVNMQRHATQTFRNVTDFFTKKDWDTFSDKTKSIGQKVNCLVDRLGAGLNIMHPSEQSIRNIIAPLAAAHWSSTDPTPQQMLALVHEIKQTLQQVRVSGANNHLPYITIYPLSPTALPQALYNNAYDADDPPIQKDIPRLAEMSRRVVLRTSNRMLIQQEQSTALQVGGQQSVPNIVQQLLNLVQGAGGRLQRQRSTNNIGLQLFTSPRGTQRRALLDGSSGSPLGDGGDGAPPLQDSAAAAADGEAEDPPSGALPAASSGQAPRVRFQHEHPPPKSSEQHVDKRSSAAMSVDELETQAAAAQLAKKPAKADAEAEPAADDEELEDEDEEEECDDDEEEADDDAPSDDGKLKPLKRPAGAKAGKAAALPSTMVRKKPVASKPGVLKRPSAAGATGRPKMPPNALGTTVLYQGGKVNVSPKKGGFRVFLKSTDVVDKLVRYDKYDTRLKAWQAALDMIDGTCISR